MKKSNSSLLPLFLTAFICSAFFVFVTCGDDSGSYPPSTQLIMYNAGQHTGSIGGRSGADALCKNSANKPDGVHNVHAFLSTSADDEISDMPATYDFPTNLPVYGPDGTSQIAADWSGLFAADILMSYQAAGILPGDYYLWTGSTTTGAYTDDNSACYGFTSENLSNGGVAGRGSITSANRWNEMTALCSNTTMYVVCIGEK